MNDGSRVRGGGTPSPRSKSGMNLPAQQLGSSPPSGTVRSYPDSMLDWKNRSGQGSEGGGRKRKAESESYSEKARNILARKKLKLAEVKNRYTDAVAEFAFIHFKGEVNDYLNWKRRPMLPQVVNYLRTFRLEPNEDLVILPPPSVQQQPEMRISGGVPVAVSTTLPAAVARLTQQGQVPGKVQGGRHGMVFASRPANISSCSTSCVPLVPGGTPLDPEPSDKKAIGSPRKISVSSLSPRQNSRQQSMSSFCDKSMVSSDQIAEKAKQEAFVLQRISELQRDGLWAEKRLPKVSEPQRVKAHWDYLLEEMVWLAADFAQERKWKKAAAKKCARMVQKHFQEKEMAAQKQAKAAELQLKRIASFMAKEVKTFWADIEKLVEFKQRTKLEEKRKKALDQHLSFLVDQTEKFSSLVAESMNKSTNSNTATPTVRSAASSRPTSPLRAGESDGEFEPNQSSDDDEETIAKAEQEEVVDHSKEVDMLKQESELPLEDFLKSLPKDYLANRHKELSSESEEEDDNVEGLDDEYKTPEDESSDDETTINEQEKAEGGQDHAAEIQDLEKDNTLSLDELMAKYGAPSSNSEQVSDDGADEEDDEIEEEDKDDDVTGDSSGSEAEEQCIGLKSLLDQSSPQKEDNSSSNEQADKEINDAAALAESIQPKGNTLSSTSVVTKIPFLLKHTLREYQHIGLDWLVTMFDRKLNGILADEMGLGKTIQTIALLAHLACEKGIWGPHLIVVPTSVMLNWEMEFKKWCPAFKILVYYGSQKERRLKRTGWTKNNAFHICITSYKLVIQDHQSFRRKKWKYLILDEAQNIKNFKSQRWQLLLNFQTHRRLLLTGTPLQNNLMELWSLMHFLMPEMFQSHSEFKEWFSKPVTGMIEGISEYNDQIIKRLHKVLRPFLLRRLKSEVEKQLPKKYEHVVMCRLSNRQRYLYDDFMSRAKTKETLASGNMLSVINVLMQLRKVCNHPNLFEPRPIVSPFQMDRLELNTASLVWTPLDYDPLKHIDLQSLNIHLLTNENRMNAFSAHRCKKYCYPRKLIEEIDSTPPSPPPCPPGKLKIIQRRDLMKAKTTQSLPAAENLNSLVNHKSSAVVSVGSKVNCNSSSPLVRQLMSQTSSGAPTPVTFKVAGTNAQLQLIQHQGQLKVMGGSELKLKVVAKSGTGGAAMNSLSGSLTKLASAVNQQHQLKPVLRIHTSETVQFDGTTTTTSSLPGLRSSSNSNVNSNTLSLSGRRKRSCNMNDSSTEEKPNSCFVISEMVEAMHKERCDKLRCIARINDIRCNGFPLYGSDLVDILKCVMDLPNPCSRTQTPRHWLNLGYVNSQNAWRLRHSHKYFWSISNSLESLVKSFDERASDLKSIFNRYLVFVPAVCAPVPRFHVSHPAPAKHQSLQHLESVLELELLPKCDILHPIVSAMLTQFPDPRLIQYDCGKLQTLDQLLRRLKSGSHRVLIFTQMTRMLDVLEAFLTYHGHIYLRLDGTTKVDQRMALMERFNGDKRIFCFILSTRSGGVGVNLTGADTVIFFDSDWNPTMDAQAQDRCHRIGQTRDVHIYRLISEKTVEENILKKANRKRLLGDIAIEGGNFTTVYFKSSTIQDLFTVDPNENDAAKRMTDDYERKPPIQPPQEETSSAQPEEKIGAGAMGVLENALAAAEDETDVAAAKTAKAEAAADLAEFDESIPITDQEPTEEVSKAEQEVNNLVQQLTPVEQWAMKFMESMDMETYAEQFAAAEAEIEQQKREWEQKRLILNEDDNSEEDVDEMLTYSGQDSRNQIWIAQDGREHMPIWCPPTPPTDDSDVYIDHSLGLLYEHTTMSESQLPPVYYKRDRKRLRADTSNDGRPTMKVRYRDENLAVHTPRSLFDRPSAAILKMRQEFRAQKSRGITRPVLTPIPGLKPQPPVKPAPEPDHVPEWTIAEDYAILHVIQDVQELPLSLVILSPGHTTNWDMVAEAVNKESRTYRSPKQCKNRYESVILPREEGKIVYDPNSRKNKKQKGFYRPPQTKSGRSLGTYQLFTQDKNTANIQILAGRFDAILKISKQRTPVVKPLQCNPSLSSKNFNPNHSAMLAECNIDYDNPLTPAEVAHKRSERIAREKQAAQQAAAAAAAALQQSGTKEQQQQLLLQLSQTQQQAATTKSGTTTTPTKKQESAATPSPVGSVVRSSTPSSSGQARTSTTLATSPGTTAAQKVALLAGGKGYTPAQLQLYREQALLRQQQQLKLLQAKGAAQQQVTAGTTAKVSVAVSSPTAQQRQVKPLTARTVSESEMAAIMKRQQQQKQQQQQQQAAQQQQQPAQQQQSPQQTTAAASGSNLATAQILAQAGIQVQQTSTSTGISQVAALVKAVPGQTHIPVANLIPQVKATLGTASLKPATAQQVRQIALQQQLLSAQRGRLPTQLMQVTAGKGGVPLIVQTPKTIPTTMTMQQIPVQQIIKPVTHQVSHVSAGSATQGQVLSHTVLAKAQVSSASSPIQTRIVPVASSPSNLKPTIQVVTAAPGGTVRTSVPNVTIDSSGRSVKMTSAAQQQALYSQVSAALQQQSGGQQTVSVRPTGIRLQTTGGTNSPFVAVAVTLPSPLQQQQQQQQQQQNNQQ